MRCYALLCFMVALWGPSCMSCHCKILHLRRPGDQETATFTKAKKHMKHQQRAPFALRRCLSSEIWDAIPLLTSEMHIYTVYTYIIYIYWHMCMFKKCFKKLWISSFKDSKILQSNVGPLWGSLCGELGCPLCPDYALARSQHMRMCKAHLGSVWWMSLVHPTCWNVWVSETELCQNPSRLNKIKIF